MQASKLRLRRQLRHGSMPQLAACDAVLREGSVRRAANTLCMAQPMVSGHLRKLSETLGLVLFEPQGRQLSPSPAALALRLAVDEVSEALERVEAEPDALRSQPESRARLPAAVAMP